MPPYQQKTDSREFEVANAEHPSGAPVGGSGAGGSEIALRLWVDEKGARTWKSDSVLVYMIADLVAASGGQVAEAEQAVMAAKFDNPGQALVAAKRIQTSILEFVACRPGERVGVAILIYQSRSSQLVPGQSGSSDPSGLSGELARMALEKARPGQILLTENVSQRVRNLPGAEFRAVDGLTGDGPTGLTELMWTTAERLAALQNAVGTDTEQAKKSEFRANDAPGVGATSIVQSPFARPGTSEQSGRPVRKTGSDLGKDEPRTATKRAAGQEGFSESSGGSFGEGLGEFEEPSLFTRTRVIFGAVALVLVTAVILVLFRPTKASKPPLPLQAEQSVGADSPDKPPVAPTPASSQAAVAPEPPQAKVPVARRPAKNLADAREGKKENSEEPPQLEEYGGYFQKDIPYLLDMARNDAGKGDYVKAQKEYSTVLKLQPKNQEAKDGQHKVALSLANPE